MKVVNLASVPVEEVPHVREGIFRTRKLLNGRPGTPGNFALQLVRTPDTYYSPRHRHNFDQVRYQLEGEFDFTRDGIMGPGIIGYFPEGTHYGPQDTKCSSLTLVLQFGGDSGSGYLSAEEYRQAADVLSQTGTFAKGIYTTVKPDGKKINKDAYEAVWEAVHGKPLVYPRSPYDKPVFINPDSIQWEQTEYSGVTRKVLGDFSKTGTRLYQFLLQPGVEFMLEDNCLYFIETGQGSINDSHFEKHASVHVEPGETPVLKADIETMILQMGLPALGSIHPH
jgi:hypothetical protein